MSEKRYVILELSDAKSLANLARAALKDAPPSHLPVITRIEAETGADIEDIVRQLKGLATCAACVIEGQEQYCVCWRGQKLGRRLSRLVDRANGIVSAPPEFAESEPPLTPTRPYGGLHELAEPTADETERRLQTEAAASLLARVYDAIRAVPHMAFNARLLHDLNGRIDAVVLAWRAEYPNIPQFQSGDYSCSLVADEVRNRLTVVPSPALVELSEGRAPVRLTPR